MVNKLKKLLDGLLSLEKNSLSSTQASSSGDMIPIKLDEENDVSLTPCGSISEGILAQNLPSSHFHPGYREKQIKSDEKNSKFIRRFSELLIAQQYNEALETLEEQSSKMDTSLIEAASNNDFSLCKHLMDKRHYGELVAKCNAKDSEGRTPMHIAATFGHIKVCEVLLDYGENIDLNSCDNSDKTPLHLACINTQIQIAQLLVRSGAKINMADSTGNTPLHYVVLNGNKDLLEWFLSRQPDLTIKNSEGKGPMEMNSRESIQEMLKKDLVENKSIIPVPKEVDFISMIQKINNLIKNSPNNSEEFDTIKRLTPSDFRPIQLLGKGSFGEVFLVEKKDDKQLFAMKILMKNKIMGQNLIKYAMTERNVMSYVKHPFIVSLRYSFQTDNKLYLILDYCSGGSLSTYLNKEKRFTEERAKIYLCEILLALEELHKRDIIYRDLKPDNVVIDSEGHALLTDFGLSKEGVMGKDSATSFCGSVAYLAPEILKRAGHGKAVDWYLLGVLLYEMIVGSPPFYSNNRNEMFLNIQKGKLKVPTSLSIECKNLLRDLLQKDPNKRLGTVGDASEVKQHDFFYGIDWELAYNKGLRPPAPPLPMIIPGLVPEESISDTSTDFQSILPGWTFIGK